MLPMRYLNKLAIASFWWLIFGAAVLIIAVPATAPSGPTPGDGYRSDTAFVFRSDPNLLSEATAINGVFQYANLGSRTNSNAFTVCNGLLMAQYLILVFGAPRAARGGVHADVPDARYPARSQTCRVTWRRRRATRRALCRAPSSRPSSWAR